MSSLYVKPNEISLERPYIDTHIKATRSAYGVRRTRASVIEFQDQSEYIDRYGRCTSRFWITYGLWDWRPFHDTVTQQQALRTYYVFNEPDVDRYTIDGQYRQVLLAPRELDIRQLPDARASWINPHFHLYAWLWIGACRSQQDYAGRAGPSISIENMPPDIQDAVAEDFVHPEIYYGEVMHEPVFVHTSQEEFNYPSGNDNVKSHYEGTGGFPISSSRCAWPPPFTKAI